MSDIKVTLNPSGGAETRRHFAEGAEGAHDLGEHIAEAAEKIHLFIEGIEKSIEKVVEFGKESVEAYFKIEKANMQLERAAGENTAAFRAQAAAMSEHLGVSNVQIETMQKLLVTYGEAPSQINETIEALQDYAAFSGTGALEATRALTMSVTTGRTAFKELGLEYEKTGEKSSTLKNITEALAKKLGGTAEEESNTLEGSLKKSENQMTLLKQTIGGTIAEFITETGVVGTLTDKLKELNNYMLAAHGGGTSLIAISKQRQAAEALLAEMAKRENFEREEDIAAQIQKVEMLRKAEEKLQQDRTHNAIHGEPTGPSDEGFKDTKAKGAKEERESARSFQEEQDDKDLELQLKNEAEKLKALEKYQEDVAKLHDDFLRGTVQLSAKLEIQGAKDLEEEDKRFEKHSDQMRRGVKMEVDAAAEESKKSEDIMSRAGLGIAEAFTSALVSGIEAAVDGGEFDVAGAVMDVAFATAAIAAQAIATACGEPTLGQGLAVGISAVGGLAHHFESNAWAKSHPRGGAAKHHDGGWIEPERYHTGGFVPVLGSDERAIIAQEGEAVLSRRDVAAMGGHDGVEAARKGGGGLTVYLSAMDTQGVMESFQDSSGRGLYNAIRTGRGPMNLLFGMGG